MRDDFARDMRHSIEAPEIPAFSPAHGEEKTDPFLSAEEEERLRSEAAREASKWKPCARTKRGRTLGRKWRKAAGSIREVSSRLRQPAPAGGELSAEAQWFRDNARPLKAALRETRESPNAARNLPRSETEQGARTARAYAAAAGFLRAAGFVFHERAFVIYFMAVQETIGFLEIGELWALKPMMQLVLLEEIGVASSELRSSELFSSTEQLRTRQLRTPQRLPKLIESLRAMGSADWKELLEEVSDVERVLREDPTYSRMDFESRNLYRGAVQKLAARSESSEPEVARRAVALARAAEKEWSSDSQVRDRRAHVGYYLLDRGKELLKGQIRYRASFSQQIQEALLNWPEVFYLVGIELLTFAIVAFLLSGMGARVPFVAGVILLLLLPATESAVGVMNQLTAFLLPPQALPRLDLSNGIPLGLTTMVVVPTLLINEEHVRRMVRDLEIRYLANRDANLYFALLTDPPDSSRPLDDGDDLVVLCSTLIQDLNNKYARGGKGSFFLFHRHPAYSPSARASPTSTPGRRHSTFIPEPARTSIKTSSGRAVSREKGSMRLTSTSGCWLRDFLPTPF